MGAGTRSRTPPAKTSYSGSVSRCTYPMWQSQTASGQGARGECGPVRAVVEVAQLGADEVAAADRAVAVHGDDRLARTARQPGRAVRVAAVREQRVDGRPDGGLLVRVRVALRRVDPQVDMGGQGGAQPPGVREVLGQADDADAVAHAPVVEVARLGQEPLVRGLSRVVGAPQGDGRGVGVREPVGAAAEVGLDGDAPDVRPVRQLDQGAPVPGADQALAPGGEQHGRPVAGLRGGPAGEPS